MKPEKAWIAKSDEDFENAIFTYQHNKYSLASFLFQQSAEKILKGFILKKGFGIPRTHDCFVLAKQAGAPMSIQSKARVLSHYYFRNRYPDSDETPIDKAEIQEVEDACKEVRLWTKKSF